MAIFSGHLFNSRLLPSSCLSPPSLSICTLRPHLPHAPSSSLINVSPFSHGPPENNNIQRSPTLSPPPSINHSLPIYQLTSFLIYLWPKAGLEVPTIIIAPPESGGLEEPSNFDWLQPWSVGCKIRNLPPNSTIKLDLWFSFKIIWGERFKKKVKDLKIICGIGCKVIILYFYSSLS